MYKADRVTYTYLWIKATAVSKIIKIVPPNSPLTKTKIDRGPAFTNWTNKCPATILALSRTARVNGRITLLVSSMSTINGIRAPGVFIGTKCLRKSPRASVNHPDITAIHRNKERLKVITPLLVGVKTYGSNPKKFEYIINKIRDNIKGRAPFKYKWPIIAGYSLTNKMDFIIRTTLVKRPSL